MTRSVLAAFGITALLAGCGGYSLKCARPGYEAYQPTPDRVRVVYLGSGGVLIAHGADVLLTGPLYSNPTVGEIAAQDIVSDHERIDAYLQRYRGELARASAVLVGHSHYDHLMDAPHAVRRWAPGATIYGNDALENLLAVLPASIRRESLERRAYDPRDPASEARSFDVAGSRIRLWPIVSEHSPQFEVPLLLRALPGPQPAVQLWRGEPELPLDHVPSRAGEWSQGTALAFVIDFLDDGGEVAFRVYYQDSPSRSPFGFPVPPMNDGHPIDLALLCVSGVAAEEFDSHPQPILRHMPAAHVVGLHWEDFLNPRRLLLPRERDGAPGREERVHAVPTCDPDDWMARARGAVPTSDIVLPCPDAWLDFKRASRHGTAAWLLDERSANMVHRPPRSARQRVGSRPFVVQPAPGARDARVLAPAAGVSTTW